MHVPDQVPLGVLALGHTDIWRRVRVELPTSGWSHSQPRDIIGKSLTFSCSLKQKVFLVVLSELMSDEVVQHKVGYRRSLKSLKSFWS